MKVYVAIWEDRHSDTEVRVFADKQSAIDWAKTTARKYADTPAESKVSDWVYFVQCSPESDSISVRECDVVVT
jgi:hypothetical protein